ncbi:hypothetical protein RRG08_039855 [Elysia crispata]|uniref:Uncharacterized protein n=1 Tax=Elysia crispata TaxID=231223 RepID=A0AAE1DNE3_9GAST|nr:hypothetical protein RRG08_039855 [Elysia crispata]
MSEPTSSWCRLCNARSTASCSTDHKKQNITPDWMDRWAMGKTETSIDLQTHNLPPTQGQHQLSHQEKTNAQFFSFAQNILVRSLSIHNTTTASANLCAKGTTLRRILRI